MVKFAHLADVHLGGWKQPELQELNFQAFRLAIKNIIEEILKKIGVSFDEVSIVEADDVKKPSFVIKSKDSGILIGS